MIDPTKPNAAQIQANLRALKDQQAPQDVIDRYMASVGAKPVEEAAPASPPTPTVGQGETALLSGAQGVTLGMADEGLGALDAFSPSGLGKALATRTSPVANYRKTRDAFRERVKAGAKQNPMTAGLSEVAGSLLPAIAAGPAAGIVKGGALFGGVTGLGHGEGEATEQAKGAAGGAALGGGVAGLALGVGRPAARIAGSLLTRSGLRDRVARVVPGVASSADKAKGYLQKLFERDQVTPSDAAAAARAPKDFYGTSAQTPEVIADLGGENVRRGLAGLASLPGKTANTGKIAMEARRTEQFPRVMESVRRILQVPAKDADRVSTELVATRKAASRPLYDKAYEHGMVDNRDINRLLTGSGTRPYFVKAWKAARKVADLEGQPLPTIRERVGWKEGKDQLGRKFKIPVYDWVGKPDVRTLDYMKRELDGMISRGFRNVGTTGMASTEAQALRNVRNEFVGHLDQAVPAFAEARAATAGGHAMEDALEAGTNIFKPSARLTADDVRDLPNHDRELFLVGVVRALKNKLGVANNSRDVTKLLDTPDVLEQLRLATRTPEEFAELQSLLRSEQSMAATEGALQGSRTMPLAAQQSDILEGINPDVFTALGQTLRGNIASGSAAMGRSLFRSGGTSPVGSIADEAGQMLLQPATPGLVSSVLTPKAPSAMPNAAGNLLGTFGQTMAPQLSANTGQAHQQAAALRAQGASDAEVAQSLGSTFTPEVVRFIVASTPARIGQ